MTRRLRFRPQAEADVLAIWDFTAARWSAEQAEGYLTGLQDTLALLCEHPDIARLVHDLTPPARLHPYRSHLVIFIEDETMLEVIRIVHMRSNWRGVIAD